MCGLIGCTIIRDYTVSVFYKSSNRSTILSLQQVSLTTPPTQLPKDCSLLSLSSLQHRLLSSKDSQFRAWVPGYSLTSLAIALQCACSYRHTGWVPVVCWRPVLIAAFNLVLILITKSESSY